MQNFNSLGCLVLEISTFKYEACHGFRAGASVHKLFVGGVLQSFTKLLTPSVTSTIHMISHNKLNSAYWYINIHIVHLNLANIRMLMMHMINGIPVQKNWMNINKKSKTVTFLYLLTFLMLET